MACLSCVGERERLLDLRIRVGGLEHRRERVVHRVALHRLLAREVVDQRQCAARVLGERGDHEVVAAEDAALAAALELGERGDLELRGVLVLLADRVRVGPVALERRAPGLERPPRLLLHVRRDGLLRRAVLDAVDHELQRLEVLRRVERRLLAVLGEDRAACGQRDLHEVAGQALVRGALVDDAVVLGGDLVDLLPGLRHLLDLVGAVVEEARVGLLRHGPGLAVVRGRLERRRDELALTLLHVRRQVQQPLLRRELSRPDDVGVEDVALARLRLLALDELVALLIGGLGELEQLGREALALVLLVEDLDRFLLRAGGVLARAVGDLSLGAVHRGEVDRLGTLRRSGLLRARRCRLRLRLRRRRRNRRPGRP